MKKKNAAMFCGLLGLALSCAAPVLAEESAASPMEEPEYTALDYVTLGEYKGLTVTVSPALVTEEDMDAKYFSDCRENDKLTKLEEGTIADGDIINIDYTGTVEGEEFEGGSAADVDLEIGSGSFIDGFESGLVGVSVGDTVEIEVTFPEDYQADELAGEDAVFEVTVHCLYQAPELTDEIAQEISDYDTAEEYTEGTRKSLQESRDAILESEKLNGILNQIYVGSEITGYPEELVNYRVSQMTEYYTELAEAADLKLEEYLDEYVDMTLEEYEEQCPQLIQQSLIEELLLKAVAETEDIQLSDDDYQEGLALYVENTGLENEEALLSQYSESYIRKNILLDQTMDFLLENTEFVEEAD